MNNNVVPKWTRLRDLGNSKPAKWSFAFPVLGYALLFNSWLNQNLIFIGIHEFTNTLPTIYFGLLFFSIASIIFGILCPKEIKSYPDVRSFISGTENTISSTEVSEYCAVVTKLSPDAATRDSAKGVNRVVADGGLSAAVAGKVLDVRKSYFYILDRKYTFWRGVCGLLYFLGFGAFAVVSIHGIWNVLTAIN